MPEMALDMTYNGTSKTIVAHRGTGVSLSIHPRTSYPKAF